MHPPRPNATFGQRREPGVLALARDWVDLWLYGLPGQGLLNVLPAPGGSHGTPPSFMPPDEHCASTNMNTISSVAKGAMMRVFIAFRLQLG